MSSDHYDPKTKSLMKKYSGRIRPGYSPSGIGEYTNSMDQLLEEWDIVGVSLDTLEFVVGAPTRRRSNEAFYEFDFGRGGLAYRFKLVDFTIQSWSRDYLE